MSGNVLQYSIGADMSTRGDLMEFLSTREIEVLREISLGRTTPQIARKFKTSPETVKKQVADILLKLEVHDRASAVRVGLDLEIIRGPNIEAIADVIHFPKRTMEKHLNDLYKKIGVSNRYHLAAAYAKWKKANRK